MLLIDARNDKACTTRVYDKDPLQSRTSSYL